MHDEHFQRLVLQRLERIEYYLGQLFLGENAMATDLTALQASVANNTTVVQSALTLIQGFSAALAAAGTDPAALAALKASLDASDTALAAAVAANTPAAPTP